MEGKYGCNQAGEGDWARQASRVLYCEGFAGGRGCEAKRSQETNEGNKETDEDVVRLSKTQQSELQEGIEAGKGNEEGWRAP